MTRVKNGTQIQIGTELKIQVKNIPSDKTVEEWKINGKTVFSAPETFNHTIVKEDADSNGKTHITYTLKNKAALLRVDFDKEKVRVIDDNKDRTVRDGDELTVGMKLYIKTQNLPAGKMVDTWKIGKRNIPADSNDCKYTVTSEDAENGIITISYTTKTAKKFTLKFEEAKITVQERRNWSWKKLSSGTQVEEGTGINIEAKDLPTGHTVDTWTIGKRTEEANGNSRWFTVDSDYAKGNTIDISYKTKTAKKFTLTFEEAKMTVKVRQQDGSWKTLSTDAQVEEGTQISIEAINLPPGHIVNTWTIGKRTEEPDNEKGNRSWFTVGSDYAKGDTIDISYTTKIAKKFTLRFNEAKMTVCISRWGEQGQTLSNGAQVEEGTKISIDAKDLPVGEIVDEWTIGKQTEEANGNSTRFTVDSDYSKGNTIDISYTTKTAKKFTLKFEGAKMTVRISQNDGQGKTLSNGAQVEEGTKISIEAKDLPAGHLVDTWTIGKRTEEANGNSRWFIVGSDYAKGDTIDISYTTKNG